MDSYNFRKHTMKFSLSIIRIAHILLLCCSFLRTQGNLKFVDVSCNYSGITVEIFLGDKFEGVIFSRGNFFNPSCSYFPSTESNSQNTSFSLPLMECGTVIRELNGSLHASNTIIVQKHRYVETSWDVEHKITCQFPHDIHLDITEFWAAENVIRTYPNDKLEAWMDVKLGTDILGSELPKKLFIGDKFLLVIHLKDGGVHKDMRVDSCWAYDEDSFDSSRYALQLYDRSSCEALEWLSAFKLTKGMLNTSDSLTYAIVEAFKFPTSNKVHIACSVQVCKYSCLDYCNNLGSEKSFVKTRSKRSNSDSQSDNSFRRRYKLMKATVQALGAKLIEKNAQKAENKSLKLAETKRALRAEDEALRRRISKTVSLETIEVITTTEDNYEHETEDNDVVINNSQSEDSSNSSYDYESENDLFSNDVYVFNLTDTIVVFKDEQFSFKQNQESNNFVYCIVNMKYLILMGSLSFITFSFFVACIGMALYLRKEKKRHKINEFLLYQYF